MTQQAASDVGAETMAPMRGACLCRVWRVDPDAPARWAERRARHVRAYELVGRGGAAGSHAALADGNRYVLVCGRGGCTAIVHLHAARRAAWKVGCCQVQPGHGCSRPGCSRNTRPGHFAERQRRMVAELADGSRLLVVRRPHRGDETLWVAPAAVAEAVAALALANLRLAAAAARTAA